jgi:hypothetical protein
MKARLVLLLVAVPFSACLCVPTGARPCQEDAQCEDGTYCFKGERDTVGHCLSPEELLDAGVRFDDAGNPILDAGPEQPQTIAADRVQVGSSFQCARTVDETLQCWGLNRNGRLGHGDDMLSNTPHEPRTVAGLSDVESFATGEFHTCAIGVRSGERAVWCWGAGDATGRASALPQGALGKPDLDDAVHAAAVEVTIGTQDTCVRTSGGDVWCWGPGSVSASDTPAIVGAFTGAPRVFHSGAVCADTGATGLDCTEVPQSALIGCEAAGELRRCAFLDGAEELAWSSTGVCFVANGDLRCAGENQYGVVDPVAPLAGSFPPATVSLASPATDVHRSSQHACALSEDGAVRCWGRNLWAAVGQAEGAGDDCDATAAPWLCFEPTVVDGPTGATDLDGYGQTSCAVDGDGDVWCWGRYNAVEGTLPTRVRLDL